MLIMAGLFESLAVVQIVCVIVIVVLIIVAPVGCWSCLGRLIRINREILTELNILNSQIRNKGRNMD